MSASAASYQGSPAHKRYPSPAGASGLRSDKTECPPEVSYEEAERVLKAALGASLEEGLCSRGCAQGFPRLIWGRSEFRDAAAVPLSLVWEARLTNATAGEYHAYPVDEARHSQLMPESVRALLWP